ncbi:JAB domain-containing protein [Sphingomonas nostoxanthinifaciens]|uniref:JAB domain-containing protein n=1 Tax=Sphingomonas nostoxanthinifaciens TaxID=2872652 RepID=UPI001CC21FC6|nr:JAB domain-containing protein [Sphingomonas nostoxanthinifaciens]UAK23614.1 JAB domain-containing protein [Sphingomonas nostoxanthinifaciens]
MGDRQGVWGETVANDAAAIRMLAPGFAGQASERFGVVFLDARRRMVARTYFGGHSCSEVEVPMRQLFRQALEVDAWAIVIAHNHPAGSTEPSAADIAVTRRLATLARSLGISLLDHLIFAAEGTTSFRALGLM